MQKTDDTEIMNELAEFLEKARESWALTDRDISKKCRMNVPGSE